MTKNFTSAKSVPVSLLHLEDSEALMDYCNAGFNLTLFFCSEML